MNDETRSGIPGNDAEDFFRRMIREELQAKGWAISHLAEKAMMSRNNVYRFIRGDTGITLYNLATLLDALGLELLAQRRGGHG